MRDTVNRNVASTKLPFNAIFDIHRIKFAHFFILEDLFYSTTVRTATVRDVLRYFDLFTQAKTAVFIYMTKRTSNR